MRSPITALITLILLAACTDTVDMPTSPPQTETPLFSLTSTHCPSGTIGGAHSFKCGRTHYVFYHVDDPIADESGILADVEDAVDLWGEVLSNLNYNLPALEWDGARTTSQVEGDTLTAIEIKYDDSGDGDYWCGKNPSTEGTVVKTDSDGSGCWGSNSQPTNNLVGLVMHEITHASPTGTQALYVRGTSNSCSGYSVCAARRRISRNPWSPA